MQLGCCATAGIVLALVLVSAPAAPPASEPAASASEPASLEAIDACVEANLPEESSVQTVVMRAHDRVGAVTETRAKIYWRRFENDLSRVLVRLSDPPDMRGAAILMLEKEDGNPDLFMYLPELRRVKRITRHMMSGSVFGTDFNYEEFQRLMGLESGDFVRELGGTEAVGDRQAWVVEARVRDDLSERPTYDRIVSLIDRERCVPLRVEFHERGDRLRKRLEVDPASVEDRDGRHIARRLAIADLRDGTRTELEVEDVDFASPVKESLFTQRSLERLGGRSF